MMCYVKTAGLKPLLMGIALLFSSTIGWAADEEITIYGKEGKSETWNLDTDRITLRTAAGPIAQQRWSNPLIANYKATGTPTNNYYSFNLTANAEAGEVRQFVTDMTAQFPDAKVLRTITPITNNPLLQGKEYYIDNNILLTFSEPLEGDALDQFMKKYNLNLVSRPHSSLPTGQRYTFIFKQASFDPRMNSASLAAQVYEENSFVTVAQPNRVNFFEPHGSATNDTGIENAWHLTNGNRSVCGQSGDYNADIRVADAWNAGYTGGGIKVGVIDFYGFDMDHPDMQGRWADGWDCINNTSYDQSNYYYTNPNNAHGMAVAGIVGANGDNNEGAAGIAYGSTIVPFLIDGSEASIIIAFQKAMSLDIDVDVINCSFGSYFYSPAIATEIQNATTVGRQLWGEAHGIVVVASHGNDNNSDINSKQFPSEMEEVISVGATTPDDMRKLPNDGWDSGTTWGSNYGDLLHVSAPGICIYSTDYSGNDGYFSGNYINFNKTSAAAPIISGLAALILSKDPQLSYAEVMELVSDGAEKTNNTDNGGSYDYNSNTTKPGHNEQLGYGRVNIGLSLKSTPVSIAELTDNNSDMVQVTTLMNDKMELLYTPGNQQPNEVAIVLTDLNGKALRQEILPTSGGTVYVDVQALVPGVYFSSVLSDGQLLNTYKVIKTQ